MKRQIDATILAAKRLLSGNISDADRNELNKALNTLNLSCSIGLADDIVFAHGILCDAINDTERNLRNGR